MMIDRTSRALLFATAVVTGATYTIAAWEEWHGLLITLWKGAGVALLALWVRFATDGRDGRAMATILAFGALGDVLLTISLGTGAAAFLIGHLIALWVYTRHCRAAPWIAPICALVVAAGSYKLTPSPLVALYSTALGLMAGSALASSLPRTTAIGAVLFVLSDLLIFARLGPLAHSSLPLLVWPLYFAGQLLIARGAVTAFRARA